MNKLIKLTQSVFFLLQFILPTKKSSNHNKRKYTIERHKVKTDVKFSSVKLIIWQAAIIRIGFG